MIIFRKQTATNNGTKCGVTPGGDLRYTYSLFIRICKGGFPFLETQEAEKFQTFCAIEEFIDHIYNETGRAVGETWRKMLQTNAKAQRKQIISL